MTTARMSVAGLIALVACVAAMTGLAVEAQRGWGVEGGEFKLAVALVVAFVAYSAVGLAQYETFRLSEKFALVAVSAATGAALIQAVSGALGALAVPMILFAPALPFLAAAWLARRQEEAASGLILTERTPTLESLLRGKRLRSARGRWPGKSQIPIDL